MKLSVKDRIMIQAILPRQGKIIEMQTVSGIIDTIKFTPDEIHEFELKDTEKGTVWNANKSKDIEINFLPEQLTVIKNGIMAIDEQSGVTVDMLSIINKLDIL